MAALKIHIKPLLRRRHRPPHRWRHRDAAQHFVIGYVGTALERPSSDQRRRFSAAVFRLGAESAPTLLWVADEIIGADLRRLEGAHAGTRVALWQAGEEAIEWARVIEEVSAAAEFHAFATFAEFNRAVDGLVAATIPALPQDFGTHPQERSFDLGAALP